MKNRLAASLVMVIALAVAAFGLTAPATAATDAGVSSTSLAKKARKAKKQAKKANKVKKRKCRKAKKVSRKKSASRKYKKKAKRSCAKAKKRARKSGKRSKKLNRKLRYQNAQYFDVCKHGCKYKTIQNGVDAAGKWQKKNKKRNATVRVQPGTYVEGVFMHGKQKGVEFDGLKILGVKKNKSANPNARKVVLEGQNAKTIVRNTPGWVPGDAPVVPANSGIEGRSIDGLILKNMWARHFQVNDFFVWASNVAADKEHCSDYVMDNLVASDTRAYGLYARNCLGGKMMNSEGWNHGDSSVYIGETPCDDQDWSNRVADPGPCQKNPEWTLVKNIKSHQNVLGYSGTNSKYVKITDSAFYNNGAGIVPNTLDSEKFEPNGWMIFENNDIFWNNYNYLSTGSAFGVAFAVFGEIAGQPINYPTGVGIVLFGSDGVISRNNRIFGNEKWGTMSLSGPAALDVNKDDDAKNLNNQFVGNELGRGGADPNGTDFLNDNTGGGNCYQGNGPSPTYVLGNGSVPMETIYPQTCPQPRALNKDTLSTSFDAGIQVDFDNVNDQDTVVGYSISDPPESQECSWSIPAAPAGNAPNTFHPPFTDSSGYVYVEQRTDPVTCP